MVSALNGRVGGQHTSVDGLDEALSNLKKIGVEADDLKALNFEAGVIIARRVIPPVDDGDMATTLRVAKATRAAKVTIGNKTRGWYSTFLEYGTKYIAANPFLLEAKEASLEAIYSHYDEGIDKLIDQYNLGD